MTASEPAGSFPSVYNVDVPDGQWAVEVRGGDGADYKTVFASGGQGFTIAEYPSDGNFDVEAREACEWFATQFRTAMRKLGAPPERTQRSGDASLGPYQEGFEAGVRAAVQLADNEDCASFGAFVAKTLLGKRRSEAARPDASVVELETRVRVTQETLRAWAPIVKAARCVAALQPGIHAKTDDEKERWADLYKALGGLVGDDVPRTADASPGDEWPRDKGHSCARPSNDGFAVGSRFQCGLCGRNWHVIPGPPWQTTPFWQSSDEGPQRRERDPSAFDAHDYKDGDCEPGSKEWEAQQENERRRREAGPNASATEMCRDIAPGHIAACVPPPPKGEVYRTPWCHLPVGHGGPHVCGEWKWETPSSCADADEPTSLDESFEALRDYDGPPDLPGVDRPPCPLPPVGWHCTRGMGHEGPCAAWPLLKGEVTR